MLNFCYSKVCFLFQSTKQKFNYFLKFLSGFFVSCAPLNYLYKYKQSILIDNEKINLFSIKMQISF